MTGVSRYDTGVVAGAEIYFVETFPDITDSQIQLIVSIATLGAALGSIIAGPVSDSYGRKITILIADVLFTAGAIILGTAPSIEILIVGRIIIGVRKIINE